MVPLNYFRVLEGPYPFLKVHNQPWYMSILWLFAIILVAFGIAVLLRKVCGKKGEMTIKYTEFYRLSCIRMVGFL